MFRCGVCALVETEETVTVTGGHAHKAVYRCRATPHLTRQAQPIDDAVAGLVCERMARPDAVDLLIRKDLENRQKLVEQRTALRLRQKRIAALLGAGAMNDDQFKVANQELRKLLEPVEQELYATDRTPILRELAEADAADVVPLWVGYALDRKRSIVDALMTVTINPAGSGRRAFDPKRALTIDWK
jgi:hypothetical protein